MQGGSSGLRPAGADDTHGRQLSAPASRTPRRPRLPTAAAGGAIVSQGWALGPAAMRAPAAIAKRALGRHTGATLGGGGSGADGRGRHEGVHLRAVAESCGPSLQAHQQLVAQPADRQRGTEGSAAGSAGADDSRCQGRMPWPPQQGHRRFAGGSPVQGAHVQGARHVLPRLAAGRCRLRCGNVRQRERSRRPACRLHRHGIGSCMWCLGRLLLLLRWRAQARGGALRPATAAPSRLLLCGLGACRRGGGLAAKRCALHFHCRRVRHSRGLCWGRQ